MAPPSIESQRIFMLILLGKGFCQDFWQAPCHADQGGEAMAAPIPVKYPFRSGLLDSRLPRDSGYFLTAYNLGKKVGDRRVVFQTLI